VLRAILLYLSKASWARYLVTRFPFARRTAERFVAGDHLDQAIKVVRALNNEGLFVTLDHLGENVSDLESALAATDDYIDLLSCLARERVKGNASLKLSQLGLNVDFELCLSNMRCIATQAAEFGILVRIDMEDSSAVDPTLEIFSILHAEGIHHIGLVFQSYFYRSEQDVRAALEKGARIRLVKGAYNEPPELAYPDKDDVDANFDRLTEIILQAALENDAVSASPDGKLPPVTAIGSHDESRIDFACHYAQELGVPKGALEIQMLYGIRPEYQRQLVAAGYPVRVYVPYGTEWYPYFMRRLAERPANLWFFLSSLLKR
jgi:proline dehydrogenase